jgi:hypothetical protein
VASCALSVAIPNTYKRDVGQVIALNTVGVLAKRARAGGEEIS